MRQKCEGYTTVNLFLNAGGLARSEQETPSWRRESWRRFYPREETAGGTETTIGRSEKTDRGTGEVDRSESQDDRGEGEDAPKSRSGSEEEKGENGPTGTTTTEGNCIQAVVTAFQLQSYSYFNNI